jgi:glycosyltransferase involved in cell wall biosynthesis
MRILLVTPFVPHRRAGHGTATVASRVVEHLAAKHELSVVTFCDGDRDRGLVEELERLGISVTALPFPAGDFLRRQWIRLKSIVDRRPLMVSLFDSTRMREEIRRQLQARRIDIVHIDNTQMGPYVDVVGAGGPRTVLVEIDVSVRPLRRRYEQERSFVKRAFLRREWRRMSGFEPAMCRRFDCVFAVSEADRELLESQRAAQRLRVFRYGVDDEFFAIPPKRDNGASLVFVGSFMHPPNVDAARWFVKDVFPQVRAQVPEARAVFVGGWHDRIADLAGHPGVVVTGWVDDVKEYLSAADVCIVPLRWGGGVKLKTLEMMAAGRAVVTTEVGAEGIDVTDGAEVVLAPVSAEAFAARTIELLKDPARREALGRNARQLAARDHRWTHNLQRLEAEYEALLDAAAHRVGGEPLHAGIVSVTS